MYRCCDPCDCQRPLSIIKEQRYFYRNTGWLICTTCSHEQNRCVVCGKFLDNVFLSRLKNKLLRIITTPL